MTTGPGIVTTNTTDSKSDPAALLVVAPDLLTALLRGTDSRKTKDEQEQQAKLLT